MNRRLKIEKEEIFIDKSNFGFVFLLLNLMNLRQWQLKVCSHCFMFAMKEQNRKSRQSKKFSQLLVNDTILQLKMVK